MFAAFRQSIKEPQNLLYQFGRRAALFNPGLVAGFPHLMFAKIHTDKALARGENIARDYNIEFLVRLSGRNQIEKALDIGIDKSVYVGVSADETVVKEIGNQLRNRDDSLLELTQDKEKHIREFYSVSGSSKALQKNIFEKIALLSVY